MLRVLFVIWLCALALFAQATPAPTTNVTVVASVEPLAAAMRQVFAEAPHIQVHTLLLPNQHPHHASLTPGQAKLIHQADLFVWMGPDAEPHLKPFSERYAHRELTMTAQENIQRLYEEGHHASEHQHAHLDPHLWLSPTNVLALVRGLGQHLEPLGLTDEAWQQAEQRFVAAMEATTIALTASLAPYSAVPYLSHHDAWGYFAESFSLQRPLIVSANVEGEASSRQLIVLNREMKRQNIRCVMAEPESRKALLQRLCTGDCKLHQVDPLGRNEKAQWYTDFLLNVGEQFKACLAH